MPATSKAACLITTILLIGMNGLPISQCKMKFVLLGRIFTYLDVE